MLRMTSKRATLSYKLELVVRAEKYINDNYSKKKISWHSVAAHLQCRPWLLYHAFLRFRPYSVKEYINDVRIRAVINEFKRDKDICFKATIPRVSHMSTSQFARKIKKATGLTLTQFYDQCKQHE